MEERDWKDEITDDVRLEILKRLPAKSLMRFKCVCKTWGAIIQDRFFAQQHRLQSERRPDASYILLFLGESRAYEHIVPVNYSAFSTTDIAALKRGEYRLCTDVVEGLACIFVNYCTLGALNVTTGEILRLPPTSYPYPLCFLGFDPLTKNYKLLNFRLGTKSGGCEILTLGEDSWRQIDCLKFRRRQRGVSVHGAIYWIRGQSVIRYFDLHTEKFMQLDLPHGVGKISQLTRLGDRLGLLCMGTKCLVLWTLSPTKVWGMQEMPHLGKLIDEDEIIGTTRTGECLWKLKKYRSWGHEIRFTSYDPASNSRSWGQMLIKITHPWASRRSYLWLFRAICDHVENILPLKTLIISSADRKV